MGIRAESAASLEYKKKRMFKLLDKDPDMVLRILSERLGVGVSTLRSWRRDWRAQKGDSDEREE